MSTLDELLKQVRPLLERAKLGQLHLETVPTSIGYCHKIGPLPGGKEHEKYACIYHDNYQPDHLDDRLMATAQLFVAAVNGLDRLAREPQPATMKLTAEQIREVFESYWSGTSSISEKAAEFIAGRLNAALASTPQAAIEQLECEMCDKPITNRTYICSDCWNKAVAPAKTGGGR